jgi:hypothetical protein
MTKDTENPIYRRYLMDKCREHLMLGGSALKMFKKGDPRCELLPGTHVVKINSWADDTVPDGVLGIITGSMVIEDIPIYGVNFPGMDKLLKTKTPMLITDLQATDKIIRSVFTIGDKLKKSFWP